MASKMDKVALRLSAEVSPAQMPIMMRQMMITSKVLATLEVPMRMAGMMEKMLLMRRVPFLERRRTSQELQKIQPGALKDEGLALNLLPL